MKILIVGGSKSSKSTYGELLSYKLSKKEKGTLYYLATMNPYDLEDLKRIESHLKSRKDYNFKTIEKQKNLNEITKNFSKDDTILLDSLTSLVTNEMFSGEEVNCFISKKICKDLKELSENTRNLIIVSDNVFSDCIIYDYYTEGFRRELGGITCELAKFCDVVIESSFGNLIIQKGKEILESENLI